MNYDTRKALYQQITALRKRPVVSYVTSFRVNSSALIAGDVIPQLIRQIQEIPKDQKEVDFLLISYGGDPTAAYRIVSILRERFEKISVLLPFVAYSAATLISLGADEIIMHPYSNLGPVDPQLSYKKNNEEPVNFGSEDLRNFIDFVRKDVGISDQEQMQRSFEIICKEVGAVPIGIAKRGSQLSFSMAERLLSLHMADVNKAKTIAETLNKSFYHHGYPLGRKEAKEIGLPIIEPDDELNRLLWLIYESFEIDMKFNEPFNPLSFVLNSENGAVLLQPVQQVNIPQGVPPQILQQIFQNIMAQVTTTNIAPIDYELFQATVESEYCRSDFKTKGKIFATRLPDNNINLNIVQEYSGWNYLK